MKHNQDEIEGASSLRTLAGISSGPQALFGLSKDNCLATPLGVIIKSSMDAYGEGPLLGIGNCSLVNTE